MKKILLITLTFISTAACMNVQYVGEIHPSTKKVTLYFSEKDIEKPYKVIGTSIGRSKFFRHQRIQDRMIAKARKNGADAILFLASSVETINAGNLNQSRENRVTAKILKFENE